MAQKLALITGGSRGIGRAIAHQLAADGLSVAINYRQNQEAAQATCREIVDQGGSASLWQFNLADPAQVSKAVAELADRLGVIDVLVNNAAAMPYNPLLRVKPQEWDEAMATNVGGTFYLTQAVVRTWGRIRYGSRIVNIVSLAGECGLRGASAYSASKAGMIGLTKSLALELGHKGVTVNAVSPGVIRTEINRHADLSSYISSSPLKRIGEPEEVAHLVSFLVSERAGFITGEVIRINGGLHM